MRKIIILFWCFLAFIANAEANPFKDLINIEINGKKDKGVKKDEAAENKTTASATSQQQVDAAGRNVERVTDNNVMFIYESKADIPTPKKEIAKKISIDYRNAPDEFTAHELFQKIEPLIERKIAEAKKLDEIFVVIGDNLEEYDFNRKGFSTGLKSGTFIPYDNGYALQFANIDKLSFVEIPLEKAKVLAASLQKSRKCSITVYGVSVDSKEEELGRYSFSSEVRKVVIMKAVRIIITLDNDILVVDKEV